MDAIFTQHAMVRAQQRGVPPLISDLLIDYGSKYFDGHGGVVRYFTDKSIHNMEREVGKIMSKKMSEFRRCYLIQSSRDGIVITVGKRYTNKHIRRR